MSIKVYDANGEPLERMYQWDVNQTVLVTGLPEAPTVFHFCNTCNDTAYVVSPDTTSDGYEVSVPNILLEDSEPIIMYAYQEMSEDEYVTTFLIHIPVIPRAKPSDYKPSNNVEHYTVASVNARVSRIIQMMTDGDSGDASVEIADMRDINGDGVADYPTAGDALRALALHVSNAGGTNDSEAFAVGQRDGADVGPTDVTYNNNAKYYAQHASENAEAWAKGTRNGSSIPVSDPAYNKHSKFWADKAQTIANSIPSDYSELYRRAMMPFQTKNISGNPIEITDGADKLPITKLNVSMPISQNGTGDPSPENVRPIIGWTGTTVTRAGSNLIDGVEFAAGGISAYGEVSTSNSYKYTKTYIPVSGVSEVNFRITLPAAHASGYTYRVHGYTADKEWDSQLKASTYKLTDINVNIAIPSNIAYIRFHIASGDNAELYADRVDESFDWSSGGTIGSGTLNTLSGLLSVMHKHLTFDGSNEEWDVSDAESENPFYYTVISENNIIKENGFNICSHFAENQNIAGDGDNTDIGFRVLYDGTLGGTIFACRPAIASVTDLESWVSWVSAQSETNALQCVFELASAQETQMTPVSVDTFKGYNKVFSTIGTVDLTYYTDPSVLVDESLSISGRAADSKATGDAIAEIDKKLEDDTEIIDENINRNLLVETKTDPNIISANNSAGVYPARNIIAVFNPQQAGSGIPSEENIRPITGYSGLNIIATGKNIFGGKRMADNIVHSVNNSVWARYPNEDDPIEDEPYVRFRASPQISTAVLFSNFKPNTQYTIILKLRKVPLTSSSSPGYGINIGILYDDNSTKLLQLPDSVDPADVNSFIFVTAANKTVQCIRLSNNSYWTHLFYNGCGVFEGNVSIDDFEQYKENVASVEFPYTIYGGTLNLTDGIISVTKENIYPYAGGSIGGKWLCDRAKYIEGELPPEGSQVVADMDEPIYISIEPQTLNAAGEITNWYATSFYSDTEKTDDYQLVELGGMLSVTYAATTASRFNAMNSRIDGLDSDIDEKVNSPLGYGVAGQVLSTNGDGTTTWIDAAAPEQIEQSVFEWISAHPEAVTTVEDGSITLQKLSPSLKEWIRENWINVKDYGAVGDGATNDKASILAAKNALPIENGVLYFPPGVYIYGDSNGPIARKTTHTQRKDTSTYYLDANATEVWDPEGDIPWSTDLYQMVTQPDLWFEGYKNLTVIGDAAMIKVADGAKDYPINGLFYFNKCENLIVDGLILDGNRGNRPVNSSDSSSINLRGVLSIRACTNVHINRIVSLNSPMDGINFTSVSSHAVNKVRKCTLSNCVIDYACRNGVTFGGCYDIVMENCYVDNTGATLNGNPGHNPKAAIDIEDETDPIINSPGAKLSDGIIITNCRLWSADTEERAVSISRSAYNITFDKCRFKGAFRVGQIHNKNIRITNSTFLLSKNIDGPQGINAITITSLDRFSGNTVIKECANMTNVGNSVNHVIINANETWTYGNGNEANRYKVNADDPQYSYTVPYVGIVLDINKPTIVDNNTFIIKSEDIPQGVNVNFLFNLNNRHLTFTNNRIVGAINIDGIDKAKVFSGNEFIVDEAESSTAWSDYIPPLSGGLERFDNNLFNGKPLPMYIAPSADLNDCLVAGMYNCPVYSVTIGNATTSVAHCPVAIAFTMEVKTAPNGFTTQVLYPDSTTGVDIGSYYIRRYDGETFTAWYRIEGAAVL